MEKKTELETAFDKKFSIASKGELALCGFNLRSARNFLKETVKAAEEKAYADGYADGLGACGLTS